ncbi:hypothetical protein GQ600_23623 [Phytophthora cactorum]|nr:hypothetical protein GQ600_23623 [Phytophthora cactorum]
MLRAECGPSFTSNSW